MTLPPGPGPREALGFFGRGSVYGTLQFLERTARRYGPISSFRFLHQRVYLIDDPDLLKEVLITRQHQFTRDGGAVLLRELLGDGLLTREEPLHRERRRILQPAFHREQIASYAEMMSADCERAVDRWLALGEITLSLEARRLTLAIAGSTLFGADLGGSAEPIAAVLARVLGRAGRITPIAALLEPVALFYRRHWPQGRSLFFRREREDLERILNPLIAIRRSERTRDVISLLLATGELSDEDIRNEIVTFVLAGHETTSTALTWAWRLLAIHRDVRERLEAEVDEVCPEGPITIEHYARLPYASMVFHEVLRLFPPAPLFGRRAKEPVELGGFVIPKNGGVFLSPYVTHRNPLYFRDPEAFRPERWQDPETARSAYFPFGGGAKMCIGEAFAKMEGVIALATFARRIRMEMKDQTSDVLRPASKPGITLTPEGPGVLLVHPRQSRSVASSNPTAA